MPYLHWATSGEGFEHRNTVIRELTKKFKDPSYRKPTPEEIEAEETSTKMKLIRAFLEPKNDRCLHVRRTLDQYYYSTSAAADERTVDQIVYKFAMKQHRKTLEEAESAELEMKIREREWREYDMKWETTKWDRADSSSQSSRGRVVTTPDATVKRTQNEPEGKRVEASWDPPKVMMVNQLWMWRIDGGRV